MLPPALAELASQLAKVDSTNAPRLTAELRLLDKILNDPKIHPHLPDGMKPLKIGPAPGNCPCCGQRITG